MDLRWNRIEYGLTAPAACAVGTGSYAPLARGVFGAKLREATCAPAGARCPGCHLYRPCGYRAVFDRGGETPPYRICLREATDGAHRRVVLVLMSCVSDEHRDQAIGAFRTALAELGFTPVGPGTMAGAGIGEAPGGLFRVRINFESPLRLKRHRRIIRDPDTLDFALFADFLLLRLHRLDRLYGSGKGLLALGALRERARGVARGESALGFQAGTRYSARQRREIPLGGLRGSIEWPAVPGAFVPYLQAGVDLGVGSGCSYGLGVYRLTLAPAG